jgi:hypothetical protein
VYEGHPNSGQLHVPQTTGQGTEMTDNPVRKGMLATLIVFINLLKLILNTHPTCVNG